MRPDTDVHQVFHLAACGCKTSEIARWASVPRSTVHGWLSNGENATLDSPMRRRGDSASCPDLCPRRQDAPAAAYAYLLGQYLGDGSIVHTRRGVYRLFISCCAAYPDIVEETLKAMRSVLPENKVGRRTHSGVIDLNCYSKHWPCLFPQHGPGKKHTRPIVLEPWQERIALQLHPHLLLRGLIHSDGWRGLNRVRSARGVMYEYPRYIFTNYSADIRELFMEACRRVGVQCRRMTKVDVSVAPQASVARLDEFIGPKS